MASLTNKSIISFILLIALAFAGYRVWQSRHAKKLVGASIVNTNASGRTINVSISRARLGKVRDTVEITGALKPKEQVDVSSKATGRLTQISGEVGSYLKRGEVVATLEDAELVQQVRRAEAAQSVVKATLQQRRAELGSAKADLGRAKQLFDAALLARQDYEAKLTSFHVFQAQVALTEAQGEQAAAELRELKIQQEQTRIQAPISGFVAQRFVDVGALVNPTTPVVRLVNVSTLVTVANVPERQVAHLRTGLRAVVHVDAMGTMQFDGKVARIAPVLDAATRSAIVEVEIPNPKNLLRAEMYARVTLEMPQLRDAVLVPRESLVYRGNQAGVFVVDQMRRPSFRSIEIGETRGDTVEVLGSLTQGTRVVSRGASMLNDGDRITIIDNNEVESESTLPNPTRSPIGPRAPVAATNKRNA